ncbi:MAG: pyrroline-5-carboxylate reductase [Verrucomicrobia bacterium]|nr:pyrroline-5-carboxylate reductase [Verrucomicrobiota bacterium]
MKIAVIGCGVMGSAFARHFAKKNTVILCDRDKEKTLSLAKEIGGSYEEKPDRAAMEAEVVLLAVKPKDLPSAAQELAPAFQNKKILISILAGTPVAVLKSHFPHALVLRTMPNLGMICGEGVIGLVDDPNMGADGKNTIDSLMEGVGLCLWMPENKVDAVTALSGSGIGFVLVMIEAMIDGGVHLGFTSIESREIVLKTMEGAVALMRESGKHPAELKLQISSPGGTTIAGLKVMEETGVRSGIIKTLVASYEKAVHMMKGHEK